MNMQNKCRNMIGGFVLLSISVAWGAPVSFQFQSGQLLLHTKPEAHGELYLFYNRSQDPILLTHPHISQGVSAGWDSLLAADKWSAFFTRRPQFRMACAIVAANSQPRPVNCARVLNVRLLPIGPAKNTQAMRAFWVGENMTLPDLQKRMVTRGF